MRRADEIHGGELSARAFVAVVVKNVGPGLLERRVDARASGVAGGVADLEIDEPDAEWRDRLGPNRAVLIVVGLDQRGGEPGRTDAV